MQFKKEDYELFRDYKDIMVAVFGISCSLCSFSEITYVRKDHPQTVGNLVKKLNGSLNDQELEDRLAVLIKAWQAFDDANFVKQVPTYFCDECYNSFAE